MIIYVSPLIQKAWKSKKREKVISPSTWEMMTIDNLMNDKWLDYLLVRQNTSTM